MIKKNVVFLSPHMDDVVLSCGGTINYFNRLDLPVEIVTIFAGIPTSDLSPLAKWMHSMWRMPENAPVYRREEDRQAITSLGARTTYLTFQDSIYRTHPDSHQPLYTSKEHLFSGNWAQESKLLSLLANELQCLLLDRDWELIFTPLGVGQHIDHLLVREAVEIAPIGLGRIIFYEDFPYVTQHGTLHRALERFKLPSVPSLIVALNEEDMLAKETALSFYVSQLIDVARVIGISIDDIREYAAHIGGTEGRLFGERYWSPKLATLNRIQHLLKAT